MVAGVRTPMPITEMEQKFPEAFKQFVEVCQTLENHYHDMQDMEFTVEHGKLYMLQTRNGKRTAAAAIKIACDLIDEGMISEEEALMQIDAKSLDMLLHPTFDAAALKKAQSPWARASPLLLALPPAPSYSPLRTPLCMARRGEKVVLVRLETSPEDIEGMKYTPGHPDRPRRPDQPRGRCGPRHGHLLRIRLRRYQDGRREQVLHPGRQGLS